MICSSRQEQQFTAQHQTAAIPTWRDQISWLWDNVHLMLLQPQGDLWAPAAPLYRVSQYLSAASYRLIHTKGFEGDVASDAGS